MVNNNGTTIVKDSIAIMTTKGLTVARQFTRTNFTDLNCECKPETKYREDS
jgi:hypothetical protein